MLPQDLNTIIGEYLDHKEIIILSKVFDTDEWNVYDTCHENEYNFNYLSYYVTVNSYNCKYNDIYEIHNPYGVIKTSFIKDLPKCVHALHFYSSEFTDIDYIDISHVPLIDVDINIIKHLPGNLNTLTLSNTAVNDYIIKYLPRYLYCLDIGCSQITDTCIKDLPKGLHKLFLNYTHITDACIKDLPKGLYILNINHTYVTGSGIKDLSRSLYTLHLGSTKITDACIKDLPRGLIGLNLYETNVTNDCIKDLPKGLIELNIEETHITDAFAMNLLNFPLMNYDFTETCEFNRRFNSIVGVDVGVDVDVTY
jgi:hypothetical protein